MAIVKFNKPYQDKELERLINADEELEMTLKRADEIVKNIGNQRVKGYEDFGYERIDKKDQSDEEQENNEESEENDKEEGK